MKTINTLTSLGLLILAPSVAGCAADAPPVEDPTAYSYQTTSNIGDLSTWTIEGNDLVAEWQDIAPVTGAVEKTYNLNALCGSPDAKFGHRTCLVDGDAVCTAGTVPCAQGDGPQNGETLTIYEIPGMALVVNVDNEHLHAGFAAGECQDFGTEDYTFVNIGLGQTDIFGMFRTDSSFSPVHHMDFGFSDGADGQLSYLTTDPAGLASGLTAGPCQGGVRELTVDATNDTLRLVLTAAGHLIIDKPEGEGGMMAISADNVATIDDFDNKEFGGISFPDDRAPEQIKVTTGPNVDGRVQILSIELSDSGDITPDTPVYINSGSAGAKLSATLLEPNDPYASNAIVSSGAYQAGAPALPGIFEIDPVSGDETAIIGVGASSGGKTVLFGSVVNELEDFDNGVKGNFILVEK